MSHARRVPQLVQELAVVARASVNLMACSEFGEFGRPLLDTVRNGGDAPQYPVWSARGSVVISATVGDLLRPRADS
jgi:hypothetical protein